MRTTFMENAHLVTAGPASRGAPMLMWQMETETGPTETPLEQQRGPLQMIIRYRDWHAAYNGICFCAALTNITILDVI